MAHLKNIERIKEIVRNDCKGREVLMDQDGFTCAVGALLLSVGATEMDIRSMDSVNAMDDSDGTWARRLLDMYGLDENDLSVLYDVNDETEGFTTDHFSEEEIVEARRRRVLAAIDEIDEADA